MVNVQRMMPSLALSPLFPPLKARPKCPTAKLFIWDAIEVTGRAMFGDEWTGKEKQALDWPRSPESGHATDYKPRHAVRRPMRELLPQHDQHFVDWKAHQLQLSMTDQQQKWEENQQLVKRIQSAADWLEERFLDGKIFIWTRYVDFAADFELMPPGEWPSVDAFKSHIRPGKYDRWIESPNSIQCSAYIFVDRASLEAELASLAHASLTVSDIDLTAMPEPLKIAIRIALHTGGQYSGLKCARTPCSKGLEQSPLG